MKHNFFEGNGSQYFVSSYFFRIEFQMRGAPHVHSLLWLKDSNGEEAPAFWNSSTEDNEEIQAKKRQIEEFTNMLVSTSPGDICCENHICVPNDSEEKSKCIECLDLKNKVNKYQKHNHTATCAKKEKLITIRSTEGHGFLDGKIKGTEMKNVQVCRFSFP